MGQEEYSLIPTGNNIKYDSKSETSTGFFLLPLYTFSSPIPLSLILFPIDSLLLYTNMSQHSLINYEQIIQQQEE